jgi:hypothetical protein
VTNVRSGDSGASYDAPAADPGQGSGAVALVSKQRAPEATAPADDGNYELAQAEALTN